MLRPYNQFMERRWFARLMVRDRELYVWAAERTPLQETRTAPV
jgi:hypothetical protein